MVRPLQLRWGMKHLALAAVFAIIVPGCATTKGKVSGGIAIASTALAISTALPDRSCQNEECDVGRLASTTVFLAIAAIAGGIALVAEARSHEAPLAPVASARGTMALSPPGIGLVSPASEPHAPHVLELARTASIEASLGRCSSATILGARVQELDVDYYRTVLVADPAFATCQ